MTSSTERRIGSSDIPKLLGLSKYGNARDVYERIVHGVDSQPSKPALRGIELEPLALHMYRQHEMAAPLVPHEKQYHHPTRDYATARPDALGELPSGRVLVELKTVNRFAARNWGREGGGPGAIPPAYLAQVTWAMACIGCDLAHVFAVFGDDTTRDGRDEFVPHGHALYTIHRDERSEGQLLDVGQVFWERYVLPKMPPHMEPLQNKRRIKALYKRKEAQNGDDAADTRNESTTAPPAV